MAKEKDKYEGQTKGTGLLYEFFTPELVAQKMWDIAIHYGFKGGTVLEPAAGDGRLLANAPANAQITAFEITPENLERLKANYPNATIYNQQFETAFLEAPRFNTKIKSKQNPTWLSGFPFRLVIANPPYGKFTGMYYTFFNFKGQVEHFFIEQCQALLAPGGLGVYIIPSSFMRNGNAYTAVKERIFKQSNLLDAYRLPANIFAKTGIGTDIIVLQKK